MTAQFKVGSVYRTQGGAILRLSNIAIVPAWEDERPGHKFALSEAVLPVVAANGFFCQPGDPTGYMSLVDGKYVGAWRDATSFYHLLPGELTLVDGEWVPINCDIALEYIPLGVTEEAPKTEEKFCDKLSADAADDLDWLDAMDAGAAALMEPKRPALTWATPKPVDRFPGFTVERFDADDLMPAGPDYDHPLQRMTDPSDPAHGSAWLKVR